jgi:ankyrin repeat protein
LGFSSEIQLRKHWSHCHADGALKVAQPLRPVEKSEFWPRLFDLVSLGRVDEVRQLETEYTQLVSFEAASVVMRSAFHGPLEMFRMLSENEKFLPDFNAWWYEFAVEAIKGQNLDILSHINMGHHDFLQNDSTLAETALVSENSEIFDFWLEDIFPGRIQFTGRTNKHMMYSFVSIAADPAHQVRLVKVWERIERLDKETGSHALRAVAGNHCSAHLATFLLRPELELDPDFRAGVHERTPLHIAARKNTAESAALIKMLLIAGADPNANQETIRHGSPVLVYIADEKGAKNIARWLDMSWSELVAWARLQWLEDHQTRWNDRQVRERQNRERNLQKKEAMTDKFEKRRKEREETERRKKELEEQER